MKFLKFLLCAGLLVAGLPALRADTTADQAIGGAVRFSITVTAGGPNLTYQWKKDGVTIPGANADNYFIAAVAAGDAGAYTCAVTNKAGTTVSDKGIFTVTVLPGGVTVHITFS